MWLGLGKNTQRKNYRWVLKEKKSLLVIIILSIAVNIFIRVNQPAKPQIHMHSTSTHYSLPMLTHGLKNHPQSS